MNYQQILALLQAKFVGGCGKTACTVGLNDRPSSYKSQEEAQALIDKLDVEKVTETVKDYRKDVDKEVSEAKQDL